MENPRMRDPRNDEDYDTWDVGMEPLPGDRTWTKQAALARLLERTHRPPTPPQKLPRIFF